MHLMCFDQIYSYSPTQIPTSHHFPLPSSCVVFFFFYVEPTGSLSIACVCTGFGSLVHSSPLRIHPLPIAPQVGVGLWERLPIYAGLLAGTVLGKTYECRPSRCEFTCVRELSGLVAFSR